MIQLKVVPLLLEIRGDTLKQLPCIILLFDCHYILDQDKMERQISVFVHSISVLFILATLQGNNVKLITVRFCRFFFSNLDVLDMPQSTGTRASLALLCSSNGVPGAD